MDLAKLPVVRLDDLYRARKTPEFAHLRQQYAERDEALVGLLIGSLLPDEKRGL
nr:MAG: hypothetical protein [Microvirus sp.]